ncbi:MAG TPA: lysine--tRNA ligase [archaeon]|nr:lysine--tRNA ligase [archaeon]
MTSNFWADQVAKEVVEREKKLGRVSTFRTEMGLGASGIPHVGSTGDGIRSFVVNLALKELGVKSEFIAFSDDRDGLRKIPVGFPVPESEIGKPVSTIDDPFGCHKNMALHIGQLLTDAFDRLGVEFRLMRAHEEYPKGTLDKQIIIALENAKRCGEIIREVTGQDKYITQLPYMAICEKCGKIYTTRAYRFDGEKIYYKCDQTFEGKNSNTGQVIEVKGCGHDGACGLRDGKLAWKVEFAARWAALKINYEAFGKDILDSVRCNDRIGKEIFGWEPPIHSFYELFTERSGKKISKSAGNVFTPARWMKYASPASLRLLFLKRLGTSRVVDPDAIPAYMDEVDELSKVYFREKHSFSGTQKDQSLSRVGKVKVANQKELEHQKRLFEFVNFLQTSKEQVAVPYNMLANLMRIAKNKEVVKSILERTGHVSKDLNKEDKQELEQRIAYVTNWINDTVPEEKIVYAMSDSQKKSIKKLIYELESKEWEEEELYSRLYAIPKEDGLELGKFFEATYVLLLNSLRGPRLAQFICAVGCEKAAAIMKNRLGEF